MNVLIVKINKIIFFLKENYIPNFLLSCYLLDLFLQVKIDDFLVILGLKSLIYIYFYFFIQ